MCTFNYLNSTRSHLILLWYIKCKPHRRKIKFMYIDFWPHEVQYYYFIKGKLKSMFCWLLIFCKCYILIYENALSVYTFSQIFWGCRREHRMRCLWIIVMLMHSLCYLINSCSTSWKWNILLIFNISCFFLFFTHKQFKCSCLFLLALDDEYK